MIKQTLLVLFALVCAAQAAVIPECKLGRLPVDKNRRLAADEHFEKTQGPRIVNLKDGKGQVHEACLLPAGKTVAVDEAGNIRWIKDCGNDEMNGNVCARVTCVTAGPAGQTGIQGVPGRDGPQGSPGRDGQSGQQGPPGAATGGIKSVDQDVVVVPSSAVTAPVRTETRTSEDGHVRQSVRVEYPAAKPTVAHVEEKPKQKGWLERHWKPVAAAAIIGGIGGCRAGHCGGWGKKKTETGTLPDQDWSLHIPK